MNVGGILLAAGGSARLGTPKQLLRFEGISLVRHAALRALGLGVGPLVVVGGAEAARVSAEVADLGVIFAVNAQWADGMGGSLKLGLARLLERRPAIDAALVLLCDQPRIPRAGYARLLETARSNPARIAAARYADTLGVPAVFPRGAFPRFIALDDGAGAKRLVGGGDAIGVELPEAAFDVDTPEDYRGLTAPAGP